MTTYMSWSTRTIIEAKLVHDPVCLHPMRSPALIEHKGFAHANQGLQLGVDRFIPASCLPEAFGGGTVSPVACRVFLVFPAEEVVVCLLLICV
jgi:hypothetical protein